MVNNPITKASFNPIYLAINNYIGKLANLRSVYNFDGVDDRGQLQFRAINPDGDIDIEWRSGPTISFATSRTIVSQTQTTTPTSQEFFIFISTGGGVVVRVGGSVISIAGVNYSPNTKYRWRLKGTTSELWINDSLFNTQSFTRGTAREPNAITQIGSAVNTFSYLGELYNVRINGVLYPINTKNQSIQLPYPTGLGPELITQSILENPVVKGSQWTYLGQGRWEYIGDGTQNGLIFLGTNATPTDMFIEFEVESFTGAGNMRVTSAVTGFGDRLFNTTGVKRFFFTNDTVSNIQFERNVAGAACSCIIKNISFRPIWVASAIDLVTNGDFNSSTGWGLGANSTIASGVLQITNTTVVNNNSRTVATENNKSYIVTYTVSSITSGAVRVLIYGNGIHYIGPDRTVAGTYTEVVIFNQPAGSATNTINIQAGHTGATTCTIDNVSLKPLDTLCNPLTLLNTASTGWTELDSVPLSPLRLIYNFDGVDDRAQLQYRAINTNGNIDIEFSTGPNVVWAGADRTVISQCFLSTFEGSTSKEFTLYFNAASGGLQALIGSTYSTTATGATLQPNSTYRWQLIDTALKVWFNGSLVLDTTYTRGTNREPAALTVIGAQTHGSYTTFRGHFLGSIYNLKINGTFWPTEFNDSFVQLPKDISSSVVSTVNRVNQGSIVFPTAPYIDAEGYSVITLDGTQSWSYTAFNIPVEPGMTYVIETIADFQGSNIFYGCQNNSSTGAIEIRNVLNTPANKVSRQVVTALGNLNRPFMLITRNVPNNSVGVFKHKFLRAFPIGTRTGPQLVLNGDFNTDVSGWSVNGGASVAWSNGQAVLTVAAQTSSRMERSVLLEAGEMYVATADIIAVSGPSSVRLNMLQGAPTYTNINNAQVTAQAGMRITNIFRAPASDALIQIVSGEAVAGSITVDNITLYKLTDFCNPLTLTNTASTGWQEIEA